MELNEINPLTIALCVLGVILISIIVVYNKLIHLRNAIDSSWSGIDTELKRRYDLIPNLVETVRGYAKHESAVLEKVTQMRSKAVASQGSPQTQAQDENALVDSLKSLFAVVENYPNLKADTNFRQLMTELINTEDRIQAARRFYNGNVRDFNVIVQSFPSNLVATSLSFKTREFFEIDAGLRDKPVNVMLKDR